jgi:hypothetical protein
MRTFVCQSCQAVTRRIEGALALSVCPFCRGTQVSELNAPGTPVAPTAAAEAVESAALDDESERPCERGEPCARLSGIDCPGGRGC